MSWEYNNLDRRSSIVAMVLLGLLAVYAGGKDQGLLSRPNVGGWEKKKLTQTLNPFVNEKEVDDEEDREVIATFIPERSTYPNRVTFSCPVGETEQQPYPKDIRDGYVTVQWRRGKDEGEMCPLKVTLDGKTFEGADFKFENFLRRGAKDPRAMLAETSDDDPVLTLPVASYHCDTSKVMIHCQYDTKKKPFWVMVFPCAGLFHEQTLVVPAKSYLVSIGGESVTLPANYETLTEKLGKPILHEKRRLIGK